MTAEPAPMTGNIDGISGLIVYHVACKSLLTDTEFAGGGGIEHGHFVLFNQIAFVAILLDELTVIVENYGILGTDVEAPTVDKFRSDDLILAGFQIEVCKVFAPFINRMIADIAVDDELIVVFIVGNVPDIKGIRAPNLS